MGSAEKFCLRWNDFESNISSAFRELREDKDFFDVTLACADDQIQAHKVILSACSPFFRAVLKRNRHEHPLLYLKGVKFIDLVSVLNFMYHGEVNVAQEELNSFLAVAEELKVKGLTQNSNEEGGSSNQSTEQQKPRPRDPPSERLSAAPTPPPKRPRPTPPTHHPTPSSFRSDHVSEVDIDNEVEEVPMVKSEPGSLAAAASEQQLAEQDYSENYESYEGYEEEPEEGNYEGTLMPTGGVDGNKATSNPSPMERDSAFLPHMANVLTEGGQKRWQCNLCGKSSKLKGDMLDHVECQHQDRCFLYHCKYCPRVLNTNRKLRVHEYQHRIHEKNNVMAAGGTVMSSNTGGVMATSYNEHNN